MFEYKCNYYYLLPDSTLIFHVQSHGLALFLELNTRLSSTRLKLAQVLVCSLISYVRNRPVFQANQASTFGGGLFSIGRVDFFFKLFQSIER